MALFGIAAGALKIGTKILGGIKKRKEKKAAKRAAAADKAQAQADEISRLLGGGSSPGGNVIADSGNSLFARIVAGQSPAKTDPVDPDDYSNSKFDDLKAQFAQARAAPAPGMNMMVIAVLAVAALLLLKRR